MCYIYIRIQPKGKPVARRGPLLRSTAFALSFVGLYEAPKGKFWGEVEAKLQGPSYFGGQPVTATECVSFEPLTETYPSETRMDFCFVPLGRGTKHPERTW